MKPISNNRIEHEVGFIDSLNVRIYSNEFIEYLNQEDESYMKYDFTKKSYQMAYIIKCVETKGKINPYLVNNGHKSLIDEVHMYGKVRNKSFSILSIEIELRIEDLLIISHKYMTNLKLVLLQMTITSITTL